MAEIEETPRRKRGRPPKISSNKDNDVAPVEKASRGRKPGDFSTESDPSPKKPRKTATKKPNADPEYNDFGNVGDVHPIGQGGSKALGGTAEADESIDSSDPALIKPAPKQPKLKTTRGKDAHSNNDGGIAQGEEGAACVYTKSKTKTARKGKSTYVKANRWHLNTQPSETFLVEKKAEIKRKGPTTLNEIPIFSNVRPLARDFVLVPSQEAARSLGYLPIQKDSRSIVNSIRSDPDGSKVEFQLPLFESRKLIPGEQDRTKFLLNVGESVWGLDWAKTNDKDFQYLAVAGYPTTTEKNHILGAKDIKKNASDPSLKGCIQIWKIPTSSKSTLVPVLEICLLVECGRVLCLEWSPVTFSESLEFYTHQKHLGNVPDENLRRLGFLAVSFGDGSCRVLNIPYPDSLREFLGISAGNTVFVKHDHFMLTASLNDTLLWRNTWGGSDFLVTGNVDGSIAVWDFKQVLKCLEINSSDIDLEYCSEPIICFPAHNTAISKLNWYSPPELASESFAHQIYSCGYDGQTLLHDVRTPFTPMNLFKLRGIIPSMCHAPELSAFCIVIDSENVRYFRPTSSNESTTASKPKAEVATEEDAKIKSIGVATHMSCIWDIEVSPHFPFVATASADGCAKISNLNRTVTKSFKPIQVPLYQLGYDVESRSFNIVEDCPNEAVVDARKDSLCFLFSPEIALQKISFNKSLEHANWVATGGAAGLVRVEDVFE